MSLNFTDCHTNLLSKQISHVGKLNYLTMGFEPPSTLSGISEKQRHKSLHHQALHKMVIPFYDIYDQKSRWTGRKAYEQTRTNKKQR